MNKEEILCKHIGGENPEDIQIDLTLAPDLSNIKRAMDEYAKQIAVDFAKWSAEKARAFFDSDGNLKYYIFNIGVNETGPHSTDQLFDIFLKQYNQ